MKAPFGSPAWGPLDGELTRLSFGKAPGSDVNCLWCRPRDAKEWVVELMLDECRDGQWVFRRDTRIQCPLSNAIQRNPEGIPYLAPEIQLLYKARATRAQDQADFDHVAPRLPPSARRTGPILWQLDNYRDKVVYYLL